MPDPREVTWRWVQAVTLVVTVAALLLRQPVLAVCGWVGFMIAIFMTFRAFGQSPPLQHEDRRAHIAWLPAMLAAGTVWLLQDTLVLWRHRQTRR